MHPTYTNEEIVQGQVNKSLDDNIFASLLNLSFDPDYHDNPKGRVSDQCPPSSSQLDISRISDRIIVTGMCWKNRTEKRSFRNNVSEMSEFLDSKYGRHYLVWNLSPAQSTYEPSHFGNQIVRFKFSKSLSLTVKNILDVCKSMCGWIALDQRNVVVVHCSNGRSRTGLIVACLLRFCDLFYTANDAFDYFIKRRSPEDQSWVTITQKRYLRYFNDILILRGHLPNPFPLQLHQMIINTVPNFDGAGSCSPGIEIFQDGRLIYSSVVKVTSGEQSSSAVDSDDEDYNQLMMEFCRSHLMSDSAIAQTTNPLALIDKHHIVFRLENLFLERDVQIRVFHRSDVAHKNVTIFSVSFNTGFIASGLVRLQATDLDIPWKDQKEKLMEDRFHPDFSVDLVVTDAEKAENLSYDLSPEIVYAKNLLKLTQYHSVRPDPQLLKPLELQGHRKVVARLALQLRNNDLHLAHEFVTDFAENHIKSRVEEELMMLGRKKLETLQKGPQAISKRDSTSAMIGEYFNPSTVPTSETGLLLMGHVSGSLPSIGEEPQELEVQQHIERILASPIFSKEPSPTEKMEFQVTQLPVSGGASMPPGPPPPPGLGGPPPPPPPPFSDVIMRNNGKIVKNPLRWNEISYSDDIKNTVWGELSEGELSLNVHKFEEMFCFDPNNIEHKQKEPTTPKTDQKAKVVLLDIRRSNNVGIGLSRFYKRFTDQQLLDAICCRTAQLSSEDLSTLVPLLPSDEERQLIAMYKGEIERLDKVEKFMAVMSSEPHILWMCEALIFELHFGIDLKVVVGQMAEIISVMAKLRDNTKLKLLLRLVLEIGNLANYDYGRGGAGLRMRGKALGFKMDSLVKLQDVKSIDRKTNLMNYLAMIAEENDHSIAEVLEQLGDVSKLKFYDSQSQLDALDRLNRGVDRLKSENLPDYGKGSRIEDFRLRQSKFLKDATAELEKANNLSKSFCESWDLTANFFGEEPKERKPEELLIILDQFLRNFKEACDQNLKLTQVKQRAERLKDEEPVSRRKKTMSMVLPPGPDSIEFRDDQSEGTLPTLSLVDSRLSLNLSYEPYSDQPDKCPKCEQPQGSCVCE